MSQSDNLSYSDHLGVQPPDPLECDLTREEIKDMDEEALEVFINKLPELLNAKGEKVRRHVISERLEGGGVVGALFWIYEHPSGGFFVTISPPL